jgi:hypothetical protein
MLDGKSGGDLLKMMLKILSNRLIEFAKIKPDSKNLDFANGVGEPSITLAKLMSIGLY